MSGFEVELREAAADGASLGDRLKGGILGIVVGDATSVHGHFYTNKRQLQRDYPDGSIYATPANTHPNSPVARSAAPRGTDRRVLMLGDAERYLGFSGVHPHSFLSAGNNTIAISTIEIFMRNVAMCGCFHRAAFLNSFSNYMLSEPRKDTFIPPFYIEYFENLALGFKPYRCGPEVTSDFMPGHAALFALPFAAFLTVASPLTGRELGLACAEFVQLFFRGFTVQNRVVLLAEAIENLCRGGSLKDDFGFYFQSHYGIDICALSELDDDDLVGSGAFGFSSSWDDTFIAACTLAIKYEHSMSSALQANAIMGGDSCLRGALLGGIIGVCHPESVPQTFLAGIKPGAGTPGCSVACAAAAATGGDSTSAAYAGPGGIVAMTDAFVTAALALHSKGGDGWIAVVVEDA
jgi:ADP-ribosyl-[dinitrogen reductase] hydrolase